MNLRVDTINLFHFFLAFRICYTAFLSLFNTVGQISFNHIEQQPPIRNGENSRAYCTGGAGVGVAMTSTSILDQWCWLWFLPHIYPTETVIYNNKQRKHTYSYNNIWVYSRNRSYMCCKIMVSRYILLMLIQRYKVFIPIGGYAWHLHVKPSVVILTCSVSWATRVAVTSKL